MAIDVSYSHDVTLELGNVNNKDRLQFMNMYLTEYLQPLSNNSLALKVPKTYVPIIELENNHNKFFCRSRRLSHVDKLEVNGIVKDLLDRDIIKKGASPYAS